MGAKNEHEQTESEFTPRDIQETQWRIAKSVLDANRQGSQALEYLLLWTYQQETSAERELLEASIDQAITEYERVLEALELAKEGVATLEQDRDTELRSE